MNAAVIDSAAIVRAVIDAAVMVPAVAVGANWAMPGRS